MPFFKDTKDFKNYFSINASFSFDELLVNLNVVDETVLRKFLGTTFVSELQLAYDKSIQKDPSELPVHLTGQLKQLVELIRLCTPNFAILHWMPSGQVSIDNAGIYITSTPTQKPAYQWQVKKLEDSLHQKGTIALENILAFLEKNADDFATYKDSGEFSSNREMFIPSSEEMVKHYSAMQAGRVNYFLIKSIFKKVEDFDIQSCLLPDLFQELKTKIKNGTALSEKETVLIGLIRPAIVHLAVARSINELACRLTPDGYLVFDNTGGRESLDTGAQASEATLNRKQLSAELDGKVYLDKARSYLDANKTDFPTYTADATYVESSVVPGTQNPDNSFFAAI